MAKIQGQAGSSLSEVYEVVGGQVDIDRIDDHDGVKLVHDLASTIFSERMSGRILRATTGDINQSTVFDLTLTDLPFIPFRILGCCAFMDAARLERVAVMVEESTTGREFPFWAWDSAVDSDSIQVRWSDDGAAAADKFFLRPAVPQVPIMGFGSRQPTHVRDISIRGLTKTFGAGTVELIVLVYIAFAEVGGINSRGLPVPSW